MAGKLLLTGITQLSARKGVPRGAADDSCGQHDFVISRDGLRSKVGDGSGRVMFPMTRLPVAIVNYAGLLVLARRCHTRLNYPFAT